MVALDEDALICDLAATYGIFDYRSLPADMVATFAVGLRDNSRIKAKISGIDKPFVDCLMAAIYDRLNWLCWSRSADGLNGVNMPIRILDLLFENKSDDTKNNDFVIFESADEFEKARNELLGDIENG